MLTDVNSWIICDGEIDPDWIEVCFSMHFVWLMFFRPLIFSSPFERHWIRCWMTTSEWLFELLALMRLKSMNFCRLLTLPSGWRIQFTDNVNFIFETDDLIHASPATISRMGIVNLRYLFTTALLRRIFSVCLFVFSNSVFVYSFVVFFLSVNCQFPIFKCIRFIGGYNIRFVEHQAIGSGCLWVTNSTICC